jgi:hypothetical protein
VRKVCELTAAHRHLSPGSLVSPVLNQASIVANMDWTDRRLALAKVLETWGHALPLSHRHPNGSLRTNQAWVVSDEP